jgi:FkbM family methyltransferase
MTRKLSEILSLNAIKHIAYIPEIVAKVKNWYAFMMNYIGFRNIGNLYEFRNGLKIKTNEGVDTATIIVVFFKHDYGIIEDNSTIIDIGGNIGSFSLYAASSAKNTKVFVYEPLPKTYDLLSENIKINNFEGKISAFNFGVGATKEKRKLFLTGGSPFNTLYSDKPDDNFIEINLMSLEDIFVENNIEMCDVLKCDCEGAEYEIFYNAPDIYLNKIKEIRFEYHNLNDDSYNIDGLTDFLVGKGFKRTVFRSDTNLSGNAWFKRESLS